METRFLSNWEAFENVVASKRRYAAKNPVWKLLFGGQSCASSWKLQTTLERHSSKQFTVDDYYQRVLRIKPRVESHFRKRWDLPTDCPKPLSDECWNYLVHLRHHGFPSPLLDWSQSEDIAAFFAFREPLKPKQNVAIFLYVEYPTGIKTFHPDGPTIITPKCNVSSVSRHVNQKTMYTICLMESNGQFCSHEDVFLKNVRGQDLLIKYVIPGSERNKVLTNLHSRGISPLFLLESDESFMETIALEEIDLHT